MNEFVKLSDLCILITKGSTPTTYGYSFKNEGIPFIKAEALNGDVSLDVKGFSYIDDETHNFLKRSKIYPNDILMTIAGANIGKTGFVRENISEANTNQAVAIIRLDKEKICPQFYYYYFKQKTFFKFVQSLNAQAAQPNINLKMIGDFLVPKLEIDSQLKVVSILGTIDDLYLCNLDRITKSKQIILNLYQEWFINFKFPNHEQVEFVDGIPEGWTNVSLKEVISTNPSTLKKGELDEILYVDISSVGQGKIESFTQYHIDDAPGRAKRKVQHGDVIWSCVRPNRKQYALIQNPQSNLIVSTGFTVLRPTKIPFTYLTALAASDDFCGYLTSVAQGAAYPAVTYKDFEDYELLLPPKSLLDKFHEVVEPMYEQIHILQTQNQKLHDLKETLLPRLMSGELDVSKLSSVE